MKSLLYTIIFTILCFTLVAQKVTIKDESDNILVEINDEGTAGSVTLLPIVTSGLMENKLYNVDQDLYWHGKRLGLMDEAGGWRVGTGVIYPADLSYQVGIGTSNPQWPLEVNKDYGATSNINPVALFRSSGEGASAGAIRMQNSASNYFNIGIVKDPQNAFAIGYNSNIGQLSDLVRINPDGKVGLGTTSPIENLHIEGSTTSGVSLLIHNQDNTGSERLWFGTSSGIDAGMTVWGSNHSSLQGKFRFFNNKTDANYDWITSGNVRMTLANNGNLGIGTEIPLAKMHIVQQVAGDAFRVDDALNDTSSFVVKSSGHVGVGTLNPETKIHAKSGDKQMWFDLDYVSGDSYETAVSGIIGTNVGAYGDFGCRKTSSSQSETYYGVRGISFEIGGDNNIGIYGSAGYGSVNYAGFFAGDVKMGNDLQVLGVLSKGGGSFKIDHPLDPSNKYLSHSFVESPDMMNIYNGNVILDDKGKAVIEMPEWFNALNKDFRYQLTAIGAPGPNLYVEKEMIGNHFTIAGGESGMKVSWQVTGIRKDAFANKYRIKVEEDKPVSKKGKYLHPDLFGKPETMKEEYELGVN